MKAVLVIDMPDYVDFNKVKMADVGLCFHGNEYTEPFIKSNVSIKPMPSRKNNDESVMVGSLQMDIGYILGWNECLDEIIGETE